jgi:hypothetical protein
MAAQRWVFIVSVLILCLSLPLSAQVTVIGELSNDIDVVPGGKYEGVIQLRNETKEQQEAKIYQTDYSFRFDGTNNYEAPGTLIRSNSKWISFSPSYVTIPPQGATTVNYTVTIPMDTGIGAIKLVGSYWSMLMVEGIAKGSAESSFPKAGNKPQMGIMQTIRYGIQIATHVARTGVKKINFLGTKIVSNKPGERFIQFDVENTGDIGFRPEIYAELFDANGGSVGKFMGTPFRLYPGTSIREMIDISKVSSGTYKVMLVVDGGGEDVFGAQHTLKF